MASTKDQVDRALAEIVRRAQHDPAFRQLCLQDPAAAVKEVTDEALPPGFTLRFIDNDHADLVVVLPDPIVGATTGDELSDEQLSAVSGGMQGANVLDQAKKMGGAFIPPFAQGACFAAGTPVLMADRTCQPIEAISPGDKVLAFDEHGRRVVTGKVNERLDHAPEPLYRAVIEDLDRELLVTPNHPFYVEGKWCRMADSRRTPSSFSSTPSAASRRRGGSSRSSPPDTARRCSISKSMRRTGASWMACWSTTAGSAASNPLVP